MITGVLSITSERVNFWREMGQGGQGGKRRCIAFLRHCYFVYCSIEFTLKTKTKKHNKNKKAMKEK